MTEDNPSDETADPSSPAAKPKYFRFTPIDSKERERVIHDEKYTNGSRDVLTFVHIGKCGGYTVADALAISPIVQSQFKSIKRIHLRAPHYQPEARYIFALRNPLDRLISAFAWRYQKVVEEKEYEFQFLGEFEVLDKYKNLNNIAEQIYLNGEANIEVLRDVLTITHFKHDIAYYLYEMLKKLKKDQVFSVLVQNGLSVEMAQELGVDSAIHENKSKSVSSEKGAELSDLAQRNLRRLFARDYECIKLLDAIYPLGAERMEYLMQ